MDAPPKAVPVSFDDDASSGNTLLDFATRIQYHITAPARRLAGFGPDWFKNDPDRQYPAIVHDQVQRHDLTRMMSEPEPRRTSTTP